MTTSNVKAIIQCDIQKVWETVSAAEHYPAWRSDVNTIEWIDEKQFIEHTKDGYATTVTITASELHRRLELNAENSHTKGHWTIVFTSKGNETEIDFTACVTAKILSVRPIGKNVFEQTYLKKAQTQFITDLQKYLD